MKKILSIALALSMLSMAAMPCMVSAADPVTTTWTKDFTDSALTSGAVTDTAKVYDNDTTLTVNGGAKFFTVADGILKLDATTYSSSKWFDASLALGENAIDIEDAAEKGMTVTTKFDLKAGNGTNTNPNTIYITLAEGALNKATVTDMPQIRVKKPSNGVFYRWNDSEQVVFSSNFEYGTTYTYELVMTAKTDDTGAAYWEGVSLKVGNEDCTEYVAGTTLGKKDYNYFSCYATSGAGWYFELDNVSVTTSYTVEEEEEIASKGYTFVGEFADENDATDTAVALGYGFESADEAATEVYWSVTNKDDVTKHHTQKIGSVTGGATLKVGLVIQGLTEEAVKTVTAVLQ